MKKDRVAEAAVVKIVIYGRGNTEYSIDKLDYGPDYTKSIEEGNRVIHSAIADIYTLLNGEVLKEEYYDINGKLLDSKYVYIER